MVDANPAVFLQSTSLVVPESIKTAIIARRANGIDEPQIEQRTESRAGLRQKQRISHPGTRIMDVQRCWDDVVIACQDERFFPGKTFTCIVNKPVYPFEFV